jgi:squalene-associated FAD-dependent desaturase
VERRQPSGVFGTLQVNPVIIVGGGLSGLAAGVWLSRRRISVLVLEQKPSPGGRACSFTDSVTGETVDNGQHVLIAGYDATMRFLDDLGTRHLLMTQPRPLLVLHHPDKGLRRLRFPALPSPLHAGWGFLTSDLFSIADRQRMVRAGRALLCWSEREAESIASLTVDEWLNSVGQSAETRRSIWEPLAISIMNEHCRVASALVFVRSLRKAFLQHWRSAALAVPRVGLSELYVNDAVRVIRENGGDVRCGADIREAQSQNGSVTGVWTRDAGFLACSALILAVPSDRIGRLLPHELRSAGFLAGFERAPVSPIVSVHLWFEKEFMAEDEIVGLIDRRVQWIFNKRHAVVNDTTQRSQRQGGYVCGVISAAHDFAGKSNEELAGIAEGDLRTVYGRRVGTPVRALVIREKRATFSPTPEFERMRPGPNTPLPNLFLAGDWTDTGFPATIEGAVVSAERCVPLVIRLLEEKGLA